MKLFSFLAVSLIPLKLFSTESVVVILISLEMLIISGFFVIVVEKFFLFYFSSSLLIYLFLIVSESVLGISLYMKMVALSGEMGTISNLSVLG